ncbi:MAG: Xaa-Pro peptidase family protein [Acidobacteria bacterium]|nr:Xaa-Pro peptidase family protein [Acidobacteriota bacterium]MCI0719000.1 Xaa-Pro peptidase family protein [Acidobacteriota bacterium]
MIQGLKIRCVLALLFFLVAATRASAAAHGARPEEFRSRRQAYAVRANDGVTILFNALEEDLREFAADKNFYYLTGVALPDAILVLSPRHPQHKETLFIPERDPAQEKWTGPKLAPGAETAQQIGVERVLALDRFQSELTTLMAGQRKVYAILPARKRTTPPSTQEGHVSRLRLLFPFAEFLNAAPHIAHLRMKKSEAELSLLKRAIQITIEAHKATAAEVADGRQEYEVEAALEYEFRRRGAARPAFPSIVGSGPNSVILHYDKSARQMQKGELVVVDIGAEFEEYAADVTRTYPVGGKFTPRQREIYNVVRSAQEAALKEVKPGVAPNKSGPIHRAAFDYIESHGKDLKGNSLGQYFIHGTSHHLGLNVHDVVSEPGRPLEPGMVITVEPGIYIPDENLGVRIEDVVLITETGYELLTKDLPRTVEEIEKLVAKPRRP